MGRIPNLIESGELDRRVSIPITPDLYDVFLCGHPDMINAVVELLKPRGFIKDERNLRGTIHTEEYW